MRPQVLVPIADGSEEIEAVSIIDVLRRAGAEVTVASVATALEVRCSRGVRIVADASIASCREAAYDLIVLPGGMPGAEHLRDSEMLIDLLKSHAASGRPYAAICAAPAVVLQTHGLLEGRRATTHPSFQERLDPDRRREERVVVDGNVITSRGPGTALEFALALVGLLFGPDKRRSLAGPLIISDTVAH
jgi:4-methyl-5(b-hydroxyethyl)-thiazole monophosphate biosynthesis